MIPEEHRQFLETHSLCIVGFSRKNGPPSLSPIYYWLDGEEIVFSTTKARGKGRAASRNADISLCVLDTNPPFPYLLVYGKATVDEVGAVNAMMKIGEIMSGKPVPESARPAIEQRAKNEGRIAVRVAPYEFFKTTPIPAQQPAKS